MDAHERRALPEGWEIVNLPEIVFFQEGPGVRKHQFTKEGIKLINVGNLANNELVLDNTETCISKEEATTKYKHFLVDEGDLIIASSGIKVDYFHKKIAFAKIEHLPLCMNTSTIRFKAVNKNKISMKFFRYFLMTRFFTKQVRFHITGSAQLNFGPSHLEKMKVILPPLEIQNKIVYILEKAEETKRLRAQADELTDRLLQSVFLEMFGNPVKNPKGWEIRKIKDISEKFSDGPFGSNLKTEHYENKGVRVIRLQNIGIANFLDDDKAYISEKHFSTLQKHTCFPGDVLIGTMGDPNLRACIIPKSIELAVNKADCIQCRPNKNLATSEYICHLLNLPSTLDMASNMIHGETRSRISMGQLSTLRIPIPPLPLQQKFARIVEKIESMRQSQNQSKQQIEDLFSALVQKAFRGEI